MIVSEFLKRKLEMLVLGVILDFRYISNSILNKDFISVGPDIDFDVFNINKYSVQIFI
jgi:hypothetical protein